MALIKSIMKTNLHVARPWDSVLTVSKKMSENNEGAILVVDNDRVVGIFSERDLLRRVIAQEKNPLHVNVDEVMTEKPATVNADTHVKDCVQLIKDRGIRHLPVEDNDGKLVGIISTRDFLQFIVDGLEHLIDEADFKAKMEEGEDPYDHIGGGYSQ